MGRRRLDERKHVEGVVGIYGSSMSPYSVLLPTSPRTLARSLNWHMITFNRLGPAPDFTKSLCGQTEELG